ncbi:hypothetical protein TKK_0019168 [Trichogramma kaykai]|uniref:Uncharacterized protein n=1 Tax=Trichogramma kaykai TaxID=54128 RepID=A0ABD2VTW9_9HYME
MNALALIVLGLAAIQAVPAVSTLPMSTDSSSTILFFDEDESYGNNNVAYAYCEGPDIRKTKKVCTVHLDSANAQRACAVIFPTRDNASNLIDPGLRVVALSESLALVAWQESDPKLGVYFLRLASLEFPDCRIGTNDIEIHEDGWFDFLAATKFVVHGDDTYDVIFPGLPECSDKKLCRMTIGAKDLSIIRSVEGWLSWRLFFNTPHEHWQLIGLNTFPLKDYLMIQSFPTHTAESIWMEQASLIKSDGSRSIVVQHKHVAPLNRFFKYTYSTTYGLIGVCFSFDAKIHCAQFDVRGILRARATIDNPDGMNEIAMHNLPGELGFVLLSTECVKKSSWFSTKCDWQAGERRQLLTRIDRQGQKHKVYDLAVANCDFTKAVHYGYKFFPLASGDFCFTQVCVALGKLQHETKCFAKELTTQDQKDNTGSATFWPKNIFG